MTHPLLGCELKADRANEHFETLKRIVDDFLRSEPYAVVNNFESEFGHHVARIKIHERPPLTLSPIIGDFIHNLRSLLDHLIWQLVRRAGNDPNVGRPQFPIFTKDPFDATIYDARKDWKNALGTWRSQTRGVSDEDVAILKELQPYKRTDRPDDHPLARLSQLSNWDKHRELHFATQGLAVVGSQTKATNALVTLLYVPSDWKVLEDGAIVARFTGTALHSEHKVNMNLDITPDVAFGEGSPLEGLRVKQTLLDIGQYVFDVFQRFIIRFDNEI